MHSFTWVDETAMKPQVLRLYKNPSPLFHFTHYDSNVAIGNITSYDIFIKCPLLFIT